MSSFVPPARIDDAKDEIVFFMEKILCYEVLMDEVNRFVNIQSSY